MISSQKVPYFILVISLISYTNAGMIQDFIKSFTGESQKPSWPNELKGNETNSSDGVTWGRGYDYEPVHYHHATHHGYYQQHSQNLDLYGLLAGLSFASLLGATIIFLATRNTTAGRKRRSLDDLGYDDMNLITNAIEDPVWEKNKVQTIKL